MMRFQFGRQIGIQPDGRRRCTVQNGVKDYRGSVTRKRLTPGRHLVQHRSEGKQISARIEIFPARLFGDM